MLDTFTKAFSQVSPSYSARPHIWEVVTSGKYLISVQITEKSLKVHITGKIFKNTDNWESL